MCFKEFGFKKIWFVVHVIKNFEERSVAEKHRSSFCG